MSLSSPLIFVFIFVALAIGYGLGRYRATLSKTLKDSVPRGWSPKRYYQGLNFLLNDEPDAAVDTFIASLDVNADTLETHLALGNLLRRRGETARAIKVHQNLLSRPSLSGEQLHLAQLELGVDFLKSGLLDRAESLFRELADHRSVSRNLRERALALLIEVYQDTQEWLNAIDAADRLTSRKFSGLPDKWRQMQAQFSCELAVEAINRNELLDARRLVRNALRYDKSCARASLLQARIDLKDNDPAAALAVLRKIPRQNDRFVTESLPLLEECFSRLKDAPGQKSRFLQEIYESQHNLLVLNHLANAIAEEQGGDAVVDFLLRELQAFPQMEAAGELLNVVADNRSQWAGFSYSTIKGVLEKLTAARCQYECESCGFRGDQLHWLCPRCKSWATIAPR